MRTVHHSTRAFAILLRVWLQRVQKSLVTGVIPIARLMGTMREVLQKEGTMPSPDELWKILSNSVLLIAFATHDLNMRGRNLFKVDLDDTYKSICSSKQPVGLELLGDDLTERLKTVKESNKAAKQLTGHKRKRNEEYSRSSYSARGSFLFHRGGNRHQGYPRRRNNYQFSHEDNPSVNNTSKGKKSEVTPEAVSKFPLLSVKGYKTCPPDAAGRIQHFLGKWKQLTHDPSILNAVRGYKIDFFVTPVQFIIPRTFNFSAQESANVNAPISKFLEKGIIGKSSHEEG